MPSRGSRAASALVVLATASALLVGGCSGDAGGAGKDSTSKTADTSQPSSAAASSTSPTPSSTVGVPPGVDLTDQGSKLAYGGSAQVIFEPTRTRGTVLRLTVRSVQRGRLRDFGGFILDDAYKQKASYYYARVTVRNIGRGDVGGVAVPLWGVNKANTLLPAVNFTMSFPACPSRRLPARFRPGARLTTCLVYLAPDRGSLESVSYRPSQQYDPITWSGTVRRPAPLKR